jgi:hypothetical protein
MRTYNYSYSYWHPGSGPNRNPNYSADTYLNRLSYPVHRCARGQHFLQRSGQSVGWRALDTRCSLCLFNRFNKLHNSNFQRS